MLKPTLKHVPKPIKRPLTAAQRESLDFLVLDKCEIIYLAETSNTYECHIVIPKDKKSIGRIAIWIKPDGVIFATQEPPPNYYGS